MSNLNSQIVDIINNFLEEYKLVDARTCQDEFLGMHSSLTVGGANEVVKEIEKIIADQIKEATINGLIMAKYGTDEGSKEERFIDNLIRQEQK